MCIHYIFENKIKKPPKGVHFYVKMQPLKTKQNNGTVKMGEEEGGDWELRRPSGWYGGVMLHAEVHEKKGAPQNAITWASVIMPAIQERRAELAAILPPKWGTRVTSASWISGWYIYLFFLPHACTHSQLRDAQVCNQRLKVRGQTCLSRKLQRTKNCSDSQWSHCRVLQTSSMDLQ